MVSGQFRYHSIFSLGRVSLPILELDMCRWTCLYHLRSLGTSSHNRLASPSDLELRTMSSIPSMWQGPGETNFRGTHLNLSGVLQKTSLQPIGGHYSAASLDRLTDDLARSLRPGWETLAYQIDRASDKLCWCTFLTTYHDYRAPVSNESERHYIAVYLLLEEACDKVIPDGMAFRRVGLARVYSEQRDVIFLENSDKVSFTLY